MAIGTYTELQTAVANWLARDDLTSRIPEFITLAEAKFNRTLLHPRMETRSTTNVDTTDDEPEFLSLPTGFQSMRRIRLSGVTGKPRLQFVSQTQIDDYRYSIDNVVDQPVYFTIMGDEIELAPTPGEDYEIEMIYRTNIPALASNSTNWLLTFAPDLYLYGALLEAAPYTTDDARIGVWGSAMATVLEQVNAHGNRQSFDSGPTTITLPGITP